MGDSQKILDVCNKHSFSDYHVNKSIPAKKLNNAILSFPIPLEEEVIALVDSTIFGSCKTGLAICNSGVYWKNDWATDSKENYLSWKKFKKVQVLHDVKINGVSKVQIGCENYFSTIHKVEVAKLLKDLQNNLKGDFFENAESFFDNADKKVNKVGGFMDKALIFLEDLGTTLEELADKLPEENNIVEVKEFHELTDNNSQYGAIEDASEENSCPPPLPQEEKWHIAINGKQEGPYDISTIKNLIIERNINKIKCHVWKKGMANWSLMSEVDEFEDGKDSSLNSHTPPNIDMINMEELENALIDYIIDGNVEEVRKLLQMGVNIDLIDLNDFKQIPIIIAIQNNQLDILKLLLEYGANIDAKDYIIGWHFLEHAKYSDNCLEIFKIIISSRREQLIPLLENNIDSIPVDDLGVMSLLLMSGLDPNVGEGTLLDPTICNKDCFKLLVQNGGYREDLLEAYLGMILMDEDDFDYTTAKVLVHKGKHKFGQIFAGVLEMRHLSLVEIFVSEGVDLNALYSTYIGELTPLMAVLSQYIAEEDKYEKSKLTKIMKFFIENGASKNASIEIDNESITFNQVIASEGFEELRKQL